jgi:hypothetical protein
MTTAGAALISLGAVLLASCASQPNPPVAPVRPRIIGNVKSVLSADLRAILDLARDAMLKEHHFLPTTITVRIIDHDHVMIFSEYAGHLYGDPVERKKGKWKLAEGPRVTIAGLTKANCWPL